MSGAANSAVLTKAYAALDDDQTILFRAEKYRLADPVRILRGNVTALGVPGTVFEYTSHADGTPYVGQAWLIGQLGAPNDPPPANVTLRTFTVRDLNPSPLEHDGHSPAGVEVYQTENVILDGLTLDSIKGNSAINIDSPTERCTVMNCRGVGVIQGDFVNIGGVAHYELIGNELPRGGVGRHFFEGGAGCKTAVIRGNRVNLNDQGLYGLSSMTILESAVIEDNWILNWSNQGGGLANAPDRPEWSGGKVLPVMGLVVRRNLFSSPAGLAAVQFLTEEIYDHTYENNQFDCHLPVYFASANKGAVTIRGNPTSDRVGARKIAAVPGVVVDSDWLVEAA